MLEFRVLGSLEVRGSAGEVALGGTKQRLVLAMLVLQAGTFVSREALVDGLWPESPPPTATHAVESYISRLRGLLKAAGAAGRIVEFAPAGYRLARDGSTFDHLAFGALLDDARAALAGNDHAAASASAHQALELWRGPALAGLSSELALLADAAALDERRVGAFELWAAAELGLGRHAGLIAPLTVEAQRHPTRERLQELAMLALYRAGRQAEALDVYRAARRHFVDELGLEPGPALRDLEERILRHDPSLAAAPALRPAEPAAESAERAPARRRVRGLAIVGCLLAAGAVAVLLATHGGGDAQAVTATLQTPAIGRLDAADGRRRSAVGLPASPGRLATGLGAAWATSYDDGTLLRIDPAHLGVTQTIPVGHGPTGVAVAAGDVWVANTLDNTVTRVDGATSTIVQRIHVGTAPTDVAAGGGAVWVTNSRAGSVSRVDPRTGLVVGTTPLSSAPTGLAVGAGGVWVAESGAGIVVRLDPRSGRVRQSTRVGSGPSAIAIGRDGVWVANRLDSTVSLIDPARDAVVLTREVVGVPAALAATASRLWVGMEDRGSLTQIRASGATHEVELPSPASALAADAGGLLVGVRGLGLDHRGGTLTARTSYGFASISPYTCCDAPPAFRASSYDSLLAFSRAPGASNTLVPDLAVQIPRPEAGGRVYRFRLRSGLRYWTGAPVRAADVRRGLERAASSDIWAEPLGALAGAAACGHARRCDLRAAVETNDREGTVTLHLTHPDPELLLVLGLTVYAPSPPGSGVPPGTGPYRVARFVPGRLVDLRRNRYFRAWAPTAQPPGYPDRILWRMGRDVTGNVAAVLRGATDYTPDAPTRREHDAILLRAPGQMHAVPMTGLDHLILNTRKAPFDDVRVRRALNFAVDRRALARVYGGTDSATPICQVLAPGVAGHEPYCPYTRHASAAGRWTGPDLARARRLVAASRTQGSPVRILAASNSEPDGRNARYFAGLLRRLGYPTHINSVPQDRWGPVLTDPAHPPQAVMTSLYGPPFARVWIRTLLSCAAWDPPVVLSNFARFCDRVVDRWADEATGLATTNPGASNRLWARADRRITDQAPWVSTVSQSTTDLVSRRVGNYQQLPGAQVSLDQLWVR